MNVEEMPPEPPKPFFQITLEWDEAWNIFHALNFWNGYKTGTVSLRTGEYSVGHHAAGSAIKLASLLKPYVKDAT